ncbi:MAG: TolC family protein [Bryobacteraceae bacterium]
MIIPIVPFLLLAGWTAAYAETHTMGLRQVVDTAVKQNPDLIIARLEEQKASEAVRLARDPFSTKLFVGSGLAYTNGFPLSIEGSAPSIVQGRAVRSIYNRPQSFEIAKARENHRGAGFVTAARREDIALEAALLYTDLERLARAVESARQQVSALEKLAGTVKIRVQEGRELPLENKRAELSVAQARQQAGALETDLEYLSASLAVVLGFAAEDRVLPAPKEPLSRDFTLSEEASVAEALASSNEIRRLESALQAKGYEVRSAEAARYPRVDLVAQYGLFGRFNNFEDFFQRFQRHNGQIGVSIQLPILPGSGVKAQADMAALDITRLRREIIATRDRIALETRKSYRDVKQAESAREVARLDLDFTREQLTVLLARMEEGRASLQAVEQQRSVEAGKWIAFYNAQHALEQAKLRLLRQTGSILSALL